MALRPGPLVPLPRRRPSETSRERIADGEVLPPGSSQRDAEAAKNSIVSATGIPQYRRTPKASPPEVALRDDCVGDVQRPPPLITILRRGRAPSNAVSGSTLQRRSKMAVAIPAAPPPTIATSVSAVTTDRAREFHMQTASRPCSPNTTQRPPGVINCAAYAEGRRVSDLLRPTAGSASPRKIGSIWIGLY